MRKVVFTLDVDHYAPEITALTFPLLRYYARKIGADFYVIRERMFPAWPVAVEKFQIYELARRFYCEWALFFDADTLIHPETVDWTSYLPRDTVAHNGQDHAGIRWRPNAYFLRDGRNIGSCNWCAIASDWCMDFWHPPVGLDPGMIIDEIFPTVTELNTGLIDAAHLVDDYLMSRNVARYGLKFTTLMTLQQQIGLEGAGFFWHQYLLTREEKVRQMREVLWGQPGRVLDNGEKDLGWNVPASILPR